MPSSPHRGGGPSPVPTEFATTHWSAVLAAGQRTSREAEEALSELCRVYWHPLYTYVRRKGYDEHIAQDLTQDFFACLLEKNYVGDADRQRGRFRTFLLSSLSHFLRNQWDREHRVKRGGGRTFISFDEAEVEQWLVPEARARTPEEVFDRRWGLTVLEGAMARLRQECVMAGKGTLLEALQGFLVGEQTSYAELAGRLGMSAGALKVAVHRLRRRYGEILREEVAQTVASPAEVDDELRHLFAAVS